MTETKFYTDRSNAKRAAEAMLRKGDAPALDYGIKGYTEGEHAGKFEIVWRVGEHAPAAAPEATKEDRSPDLTSPTSCDAPQAASPAQATNGATNPTKVSQRAPAAPLKPGELPEKPVVTSAANQSYQKRFDRLLELAAQGDWAGVAAYEVKGQNTYGKAVARYRDALLAAHQAAG
jgi:hypothetical protein